MEPLRKFPQIRKHAHKPIAGQFTAGCPRCIQILTEQHDREQRGLPSLIRRNT